MTEARIKRFYRNQVIHLFLLATVIGVMIYLLIPTKPSNTQKDLNEFKPVVAKTESVAPQKIVIEEKLVVKTNNVKKTAIKKSTVIAAKKVKKSKIPVLDFSTKKLSEEKVAKKVHEGNMILAKGAKAVLTEDTVITGNLYILNIKSILRLPKGLEVKGHIFVKDARQVVFPDNVEVGGNVYIYGDTGFHSIPQTAKIKGQLYI